MSYIAEHCSEKEGEGDDGERCRVDLAVVRDSIGVDDFLEGMGKLVDLEMGRRFLFCGNWAKNGGNQRTTPVGGATQGELDFFRGGDGAPAFGDETLATNVVVEQVHCVVDGLFLHDLATPYVEVQIDVHKDLTLVVVCPVQNNAEVLETAIDLFLKLSAALWAVGAGIHIGSERFADLLDLALGALTLEEHYDDILELDFTLGLSKGTTSARTEGKNRCQTV